MVNYSEATENNITSETSGGLSAKLKASELLCRGIDCKICVKNSKLSGDFSRHGNCMYEIIQPL